MKIKITILIKTLRLLIALGAFDGILFPGHILLRSTTILTLK